MTALKKTNGSLCHKHSLDPDIISKKEREREGTREKKKITEKRKRHKTAEYTYYLGTCYNKNHVKLSTVVIHCNRD